MSNPTRMGLIVFPFFVFACIWWASRKGWSGAVISRAEEIRLLTGTTFSWFFIGTALLAIICVIIATCALASIRIGGPEAKPRLTQAEMIAVGFAATTSIGLIVWAAAEPVMHVYRPPPVNGLQALSPETQLMARSAAYVHWALMAHMIFALFMIGFAMTTGTMRLSPSLDSAISGRRSAPFSLTAGVMDGSIIAFVTLAMIAGLATCILFLSLQITQLSGVFIGRWGATAMLVGMVFVALLIAARPIGRSYAVMALASLALLMLFILIILIFAPKGYVTFRGLRAIWWSVRYFPDLAMNGFIGERGDWAGRWTVTYLGGWMLLGPLVGYFLSRAARGYRVSEAVCFLILVPMLITVLLVLAVSGLTIWVDGTSGGAVMAAIRERGPESAIIVALSTLTGSGILKALLILLTVLFFLTFSGAVLHAVLRIAVPGEDSDRRVIMERRAGLLIWCVAYGGAAWLTARGNMVPMVESVARLGGIVGVLITFIMTFSVFRLCFLPASRFKPPVPPDAADYKTQEALKIGTVEAAKPAGTVYKTERRRQT